MVTGRLHRPGFGEYPERLQGLSAHLGPFKLLQQKYPTPTGSNTYFSQFEGREAKINVQAVIYTLINIYKNLNLVIACACLSSLWVHSWWDGG